MLKETLYFKESSLEYIIFAILEGGTCALIYNRTVKMGNLELIFLVIGLSSKESQQVFASFEVKILAAIR